MSEVAFPHELIRASAGTGKTYQISNRVIGLLAEGVEAERILASTFTRKAAGEILDRIFLRLADGALDASEAEQLSQDALLPGGDTTVIDSELALALLVRLVRSLHRIDVGTLDALFVRMARSFSLDMGLPAGWQIADESHRKELRSEAVQALLRDDDTEALVQLLRMATRDQADRRVHARLVDDVEVLHHHHLDLDPNADQPWSPFDDRSVPGDIEAGCRELAGRLARLAPPTNKDGTPNKPWLTALEDAVEALEHLDWEAFWAKGPQKKFLAGERAYYGKAFPPDLESILEEARSLAAVQLASTYEGQARALGRIARRYHEALRAEQRRAGAYGFRDVAELLGGSEPVGARPDLHHRLDRRSEHVLLDEFQDTSVSQWMALRPLVDRIMPDGERGGSLVVVADPKQSIYGWRGADPEIVARVGRRYDLEVDSLRDSWRSSPVVLAFVNRLFTGIEDNPIVRETDGAVRVVERWSEAFEEHRSAPPLDGRPGRVTIEVGPRDEGGGTDRPLLMKCAARRVAELHREAPGASLGVLVRKNKTVARLIHELRAYGIEASEEGGTPVDDAAPVAALLAFLRMADHPGNRIARYHVAASPLGRVVDFTDHRDDATARRRAAEVRAELLDGGYGSTLHAWIEELAPSVDASELRRLEQLVELGFRWDDRATLRPGDFVRFVESETVEDPLSTPVRVMTVHQAKGLEFDVVVLPELDDTIRTGKVETALPERDPETGLIRRVFPPVDSRFRFLFPELETALAQERAASIRDELSWLYVGVTRARHALHLLMAADDGSSGARSFARLIRAAVGRHGEAAREGETIFAAGDPHWHRDVDGTGQAPEIPVPEDVVPRVDRGAPRSRLLTLRTPSDLESEGRVDPDRLLRLDTSAALREGEVVHRWCEDLEWIDDYSPSEGVLVAAARAVAPELTGFEIQRLAEEFLAWLVGARVVASLARGPTEARLRSLASSLETLDGPATERSFAHRRGDEIVSGVIDRLILARDDQGDVVAAEVTDFKTDVLDPNDEERVDQRVEVYRPQIEAYREAVASSYRLEESRVDARLLFLRADLVHSI